MDMKNIEEYAKAKSIVLEAHKKFLERHEGGICLNFEGEDLRFAQFAEADFSRSSFNGARFHRANFSNCSFHLSRFIEARLTRIIMTRAIFRPSRRRLDLHVR